MPEFWWNVAKNESAKGKEVEVILTVGPLGPGNPMLPGSPLAPAGPMGPGRPSIPGRPWNQSWLKRYLASTRSHDLRVVVQHLHYELWIHFPFLRSMSLHTQPGHFIGIQSPLSLSFHTLSPSPRFPVMVVFFSFLSFPFSPFSPVFFWTP